MKIIHSIGLSLCMPLLFACTHSETVNQMSDQDTIPVKTMMLHKGDNKQTIAVSGQFTTDDETMLSFKTGGIISDILVKEGDAVKKGQLLAALNPTEINAQVQQAELSAEKASRDYQRIQNLFKDSVATLEQMQNGKTGWQQAQQQLKIARFNLQYSQIRAAKDGYILKKLANPGQQVTAGTAILQANGAESGKWLLRVGISDREWSMLQLNDRARIETTALSGQVLEGLVSRKAEGVDPATGTFTVDIILTSKKPKGIAAGMFGKAVITPSTGKHREENWQIPYEALLDGDGGSGYVFITNDDKTAHKIKVSIGSIDKNTVTVTAGLDEAKALIISGSAYLNDNSLITVNHH